jgi:S-layer family protein
MPHATRPWAICALALGVLSADPRLAAQAPSRITRPPVIATPAVSTPKTYGTGDASLYNLGPDEFTPLGYSAPVFLFSNLNVRPLAGGAVFINAPLHLPAGALVTAIDFYYLDADPGANPEAYFIAAGTGGAVYSHQETIVFPNTASGLSAITAVLPIPVTIDNAANHYSIQVALINSLQLHRVSVTYQLQVSPAPGTATFSDVPVGHPFHQFVQALVAAGITGGCGGGNYCPDAPLTRGQMAVFLAAALGLHWPN